MPSSPLPTRASRRPGSIPYRRLLSLALLALWGGALATGALARQPDAPSPLGPVNAVRYDAGVHHLTEDGRLEGVARDYLGWMLHQRCLCPLPADEPATRLTGDVAAALGMPPETVHHAGIVVSYDLNVERAIAAAMGRPESGAALYDRHLTLVGLAAGMVQPGQSWLAPPVGGDGPPVDLTGYQLVVIVTAGEQR